MNLEQRLYDLATKIDDRLATLRTRTTALEARPTGTPIAVGTSPPSNPAVNDLWVDTN